MQNSRVSKFGWRSKPTGSSRIRGVVSVSASTCLESSRINWNHPTAAIPYWPTFRKCKRIHKTIEERNHIWKCFRVKQYEPILAPASSQALTRTFSGRDFSSLLELVKGSQSEWVNCNGTISVRLMFFSVDFLRLKGKWWSSKDCRKCKLLVTFPKTWLTLTAFDSRLSSVRWVSFHPRLHVWSISEFKRT